MNAVRFHHQGPPEVLQYEETPDPVPGRGEVLVRVRAASLNRLDVWVRSMLPNITLPHILGSDGAGEVLAVGDGVTAVHIGQRVAILPAIFCGVCDHCLAGEQTVCDCFQLLGRHRDGTYAELLVVPPTNLYPIPDAITYEETAAMPVTFLTAWHMLITRAGLQAGETVLIVGASGGLGTAAIQIAKLAGARIIATAGTDEKATRLMTLGVDHVVHYHTQQIPEEVLQFTLGKGVDVAFEHVGPATLPQSLQSLRSGGRLVICGAATGPTASIPIREFYSRQLSIIGSMAGTPLEFGSIIQLAGEGKLRPVIDRVLPLSHAAEAHRLMEAGQVFGKIVFVPD